MCRHLVHKNKVDTKSADTFCAQKNKVDKKSEDISCTEIKWTQKVWTKNVHKIFLKVQIDKKILRRDDGHSFIII